ncbi:OsmC family protein [Fulvivirgaceae bacterium PWU4]|uniref:OsmC family protein n=1 Tax=Chryseosolibacter histidini TaxID=2782349 RepID=A0AAP2DNN7_9BACT|nr:OsmC family protein [Chryseosolibacter histidini]MBT1699678.1 OsmC family protein [Chryseosolibacter histidini]
MTITATIRNSHQQNDIVVSTNGNSKGVVIPGKVEGGSSVNGGELLFLALATCFCNDIYREAARRKMTVTAVEVTVRGQFGKEGEPASNITYEANVQAPKSSPQEIAGLIAYVDGVAEVHNTLRKGVSVTLK